MSQLTECDVISMRKMENHGNLKAFVDLRVGGALVIRGCTVMNGKNGMFASMPRRLMADGSWIDVVFTADDKLKTHYRELILHAYEDSDKS